MPGPLSPVQHADLPDCDFRSALVQRVWTLRLYSPGPQSESVAFTDLVNTDTTAITGFSIGVGSFTSMSQSTKLETLERRSLIRPLSPGRAES